MTSYYRKPITDIPVFSWRKTGHNEQCGRTSGHRFQFRYHSTGIVVVHTLDKTVTLCLGGYDTYSTHTHINDILTRLHAEFDWVPRAYTLKGNKNRRPALVLREHSPEPVFVLAGPPAWAVRTSSFPVEPY